MNQAEWDIEHDIQRKRLYACGMNWDDADIRARTETENQHGPRPKKEVR